MGKRIKAMAGRWLAVAVSVGLAVLATALPAAAFDIPDADGAASGALYLDLIINGTSRGAVVEVRQEPDGSWTVDPEDLRAAGLLPNAAARRKDGRIDLARLPGISFSYDQPRQALVVTADSAVRAPLLIRARPRKAAPLPAVDAEVGGLLNYSVLLSPGYAAQNGDFHVVGLSGAFEARLFGPFGVLSHSFSTVDGDPTAFHRQNTSWSYASPAGGWRATAGDFATGSLGWSRPTRMGGLQFRNDFSLRPDIVTFPVPGMSGSAALPSTAEVYVNGIERYSTEIPDGPFSISDIPMATGAGTAMLVVRDQNGKQVVVERPYFVSDQLLRPGLFDYSAELGFARSHFGDELDRYDPRLMASASIRYGLADWLTFEGHAEGGEGVLNAGLGAVVGLVDRGVATIAVSGSSIDGETGVQAYGSLSFDLAGIKLQARMQRSFGAYGDIASVTYPADDAATAGRGAPPRALDQLSVSLPLPIEPLRLNLNYTQLELGDDDLHRVLGLGYAQPLWGGTFSTSAAVDLADGGYRVVAGFSRAIGDDMRAGTAISAGEAGARASTRIGSPMGPAVGDVGWRLLETEGETRQGLASVETRTPVATLEASLSYTEGRLDGSARMRGAIVATRAGLALANPIDDAFAIVDAGYPNVPVLLQNQQVGITGADGKLVVTGLRSYERNRLGIDSSDLPIDAVIAATRRDVVPADGAGVVIAFGGGAGGSAVVTFRDAAGAPLPLGSTGAAGDGAPPFMVGYDGQAFVVGLGPRNRITLALPGGGSCVAEFAFTPQRGAQVALPDVTCQPG